MTSPQKISAIAKVTIKSTHGTTLLSTALITNILKSRGSFNGFINIPPLVIEKKVIPPPPQAKKIVDVIKVVEEEVEIDEQELVSVQDMSEYADVEDTDIIFVEEEVEEEKIFDVVEEQPEFPGGNAALMRYFKDNIKYPRVSRDNNSQGKSFVRFTVNTDGSIQDVEVIRTSSDIYLDKEAIRVIEAMPKWKPGRQLGKAVRVKFVLPVNFRLQ